MPAPDNTESQIASSRQVKALQQQLQDMIQKMQRLQSAIAADGQPASFHQIDELMRMGTAYAQSLDELAALEQQEPLEQKA